MRFRELRIAWSLMCGVVAVLLIAMCVRSYWTSDLVKGHAAGAPSLFLISLRGSIFIDIQGWDQVNPVRPKWRWFPSYKIALNGLNGNALGFRFIHRTSGPEILLPYWFLVLIPMCFAVFPWVAQLSWRFSLRTLLTITTLIALVLTLVFYLAKTS
jgi:hypothetical protein